ncbi:hypothetical protein [Paenirhodobacter populi]|uniref:Uncharacterized protein n=1 Tax=Paenirhodobacter populi TaxID=2306993 RepID=A0A443J889_9RHOB|nr:hypothetical protein [Sinirhodobacter populi]RWR16703.1 hypothetical protein D2T30_20920 [Sinirhodobacter populi]
MSDNGMNEANVFRFEVEELKRWRDEAGLRVLPSDEGVCSDPRDSRDIRAMLNLLCERPATHGEAAALIAHEIEARKVKLRAIGEPA